LAPPHPWRLPIKRNRAKTLTAAAAYRDINVVLNLTMK
jgi:hypothetical protein